MRPQPVAVIAAALLALGAPASAQLFAELVIHNANVHTLDQANIRVQAIAVRDGRIVAVGSNDAMRPLAGPGTRMLDAGGRTVVPGLFDSHIHLSSVAHDLNKVQTRDLRSVAEFLARIKDVANKQPDGRWIETAADWHESQLAEKRFPTRWEVDEVAPRHPVFIRRGGHNVVINTVAMQLAGIAEDAQDPQGGHYVRDGQGRFTGWILERPAIAPVARLLPRPSAEENVRALKRAMAILNAVGVTSVRDMHVDAAAVAAWQKLAASGEATVRGYLMLSVPPRGAVEQETAKWGALGIASGFGDDRLRIGGLKITYDGGVEASLLTEDFANKPGFKGIPVTPPERVMAVAKWACEHGWQMGVHTVGDRAIADVLDIYETIDKTCPIGGKRWALEHPYLLSPKTLAQIKALGVVPTMQSGHNYTLGAGWVEYWGKARADRSIPNRTLIDNGILPAGGTDAPVTPYNPFLAMWADVTRETAAAGVLGLKEAVTPLEALRMHTVWAARASFDETRLGTIEPGKLADLVILSDDPLAVPPARLKDIVAHTTIVGGRVVYQR